jgi:predicted nucleic acid-binding Zn ribbon protein
VRIQNPYGSSSTGRGGNGDDDHRHCKVCGKVCDPKAEVCSPACREKRERLLAARRTYTYLLYGSIVVVVLAFILAFGHG